MALCTFREGSVLARKLRELAYDVTLSIHYNGEKKGRYIPYKHHFFGQFAEYFTLHLHHSMQQINLCRRMILYINLTHRLFTLYISAQLDMWKES
jgi:hypothetical protein